MQEAIASLGAAGKVDDMDLDEAAATEKKSNKSKKKRSAEDTETGQCYYRVYLAIAKTSLRILWNV